MVQGRNTENQTPDRRDLLSSIWLFISGAVLIGLLAIGTDFLRSLAGKPRRNKVRELVAGPVGAFAPGSVSLIRQGGGYYLSRLEDGGILALSMRCSHLGCAVSWHQKEARFICPCHGSVFDRTGNVITAPAPRALALFPVRIEKGIIHIDLSRPIKRALFSADQAVYPGRD